MNQKKFQTLSLSKEMLANLGSIGYKEMTSVQSEALPDVLDGKDVTVQAKTGSGKTAVFGIGILDKIEIKKFHIQSLVLCPTRELADQVAKELRKIAKFAHNIKILTLCGGVAFYPQANSLRHGAHVVVGTPGRILKHLDKENLKLDNLQILVLDEADRMLDMGFVEEIEKILNYVPKHRQTLLFSATYPDEITALSSSIQKNPINIKTTLIEDKNKITQRFYKFEDEQKFQALVNVFGNFNPDNAIVFCNTKLKCDEVAQKLQDKNIDALAIHGDLQQFERNDVLVQFANKSCRVLVATDVAARGLDIKELECIINYDMPHAKETYIHRIGRTGRAGHEGLAFAFYNKNDDISEYKDENIIFEDVLSLENIENFDMKPLFATIVIEGGKKNKIRKGDILGALTGDVGLYAGNVGQIDIYDKQSYVAIKIDFVDEAYKKLLKCKIKGKRFSVWIV